MGRWSLGQNWQPQLQRQGQAEQEVCTEQPYRGSWLMVGYRQVPLQCSWCSRFVPRISKFSVWSNWPSTVELKCTFSSAWPRAGTIHRKLFSLVVKKDASRCC